MFLFEWQSRERQKPRGGAASAARQQGDLWPTTKAGRIFLPKTRYFVVAYLLEYLRATARPCTVYFANARLETTITPLKHKLCGPNQNKQYIAAYP